jgi:glycosyltransferase involved in cell wall biosynthesis
MKIALFVHCFYPGHFYGTEAYTLSLAKALQALGHEPVVVSATFAGEAPQSDFIVRYDWDGVPVVAIDKNQLPNRGIRDTYDQSAMRVVHERLLRGLKPDVAHVTHLINHTAALLDVTSALGIPTFGTLTDFFGFCLNNKLQAADNGLCAGPNPSRSNCMACYIKDAALAPTASSALKAASRPPVREIASAVMVRTNGLPGVRLGFAPRDIVDRPGVLAEKYKAFSGLIAPSTFLHDAYLANGLATPLRLSHFGIEIDRRPKPPSATPDKIRLGFIGQIAPHKGPHLVLEAMRELAATNLSLELWGPESQSPDYSTQLRTLAAELDVRFRGTFPVERTAEILAELDVLVVPSTWYENSPLILLQALATHTPVIVSDTLGMTEFVEGGRTGFSFARGDVHALAAVLRRFAERPALAVEMSAQTAYARTPLDMARDVVELYRQHAPGVVA